MVKLRSLALHTVGTVPWGEDDSHVLPDVMLGAWNVPEFPLALSFGAAGLYWIEGTVIFCPFTAGALLLNWPTGLLLNVQLWQTGPSLSFSVPPLDVHWALVESTALANWAIFILQCSPVGCVVLSLVERALLEILHMCCCDWCMLNALLKPTCFHIFNHTAHLRRRPCAQGPRWKNLGSPCQTPNGCSSRTLSFIKHILLSRDVGWTACDANQWKKLQLGKNRTWMWEMVRLYCIVSNLYCKLQSQSCQLRYRGIVPSEAMFVIVVSFDHKSKNI